MKIVATTRTLNEEKNIARFIAGYSKFCDNIYIVDGGSEDDTVSIALNMGAIVEEQPVFVSKETKYGEVRRNPQGVQINSCIQGAIDLGADWILFGDADGVPTRSLQSNARMFMEMSLHPSLFLYRMYVYGYDRWFPEMNRPGQSLWAWKPSELDIWANEENPWEHHMENVPSQGTILEYPYSILHYFAPDEVTIERKRNFFTRAKETEIPHPLDSFGKLEDLPEWAKWK